MERFSDTQVTSEPTAYLEEHPICEADHLGCTVFRRTRNDNQVAPSIQDAKFIEIMDEGQQKDTIAL